MIRIGGPDACPLNIRCAAVTPKIAASAKEARSGSRRNREMGRGDSGIYTYCVFEHQPDYGDSSLGEARFCVKLNNDFDWMLVDRHHNFLYPQSAEAGDDKYNYTSVQYEHPAFGWASTTKNVGFFFVNASVEALSIEWEKEYDAKA